MWVGQYFLFSAFHIKFRKNSLFIIRIRTMWSVHSLSYSKINHRRKVGVIDKGGPEDWRKGMKGITWGRGSH